MTSIPTGRRAQRGQGMTEYVIIVALIAIAAIGVYTAFGSVVRAQTGVVASELGGYSGNEAKDRSKEASDDAVSSGKRSDIRLNNFNADTGTTKK